MSGARTRLKDAACQDQSPLHEKLDKRVRCNRPIGHAGPHQKIRAADFLVVFEWVDLTYTRMHGKAVPDEPR